MKKAIKIVLIIIGCLIGGFLLFAAGVRLYYYLDERIYHEYFRTVDAKDTALVVELDKVVNKATFSRGKESDSIVLPYDKGEITASIEDGKVIIYTTNKVIKIKNIKDAVSVLIARETNSHYAEFPNVGKVYVLDKNDNFYAVSYNTDYENVASVSKYNIDDIDSYSVDVEEINTEKKNCEGYVVIKTKDGKYYSDYRCFYSYLELYELENIESDTAIKNKRINEELDKLPTKNDSDVVVNKTIMTKEIESEEDEEPYEESVTTITYKYNGYTIILEGVAAADDYTLEVKNEDGKVLKRKTHVSTSIHTDTIRTFEPVISSGKIYYFYYNTDECYTDDYGSKVAFAMIEYIDLYDPNLDEDYESGFNVEDSKLYSYYCEEY